MNLYFGLSCASGALWYSCNKIECDRALRSIAGISEGLMRGLLVRVLALPFASALCGGRRQLTRLSMASADVDVTTVTDALRAVDTASLLRELERRGLAVPTELTDGPPAKRQAHIVGE